MAFFKWSLLAVLAINVRADCPAEYKELNKQCFRATEARVQANAVASCTSDEFVVDGEDVAYFNAVKALFLAPGQPGPSTGGGGAGKFFWTVARASSPSAATFNLPNGAPATDSNGDVIVRDPQNDPMCLAGWSRSADYVPVDCNTFNPAICRKAELVYNPNKSSWTARGSSVYPSAANAFRLGPQFAIDGSLSVANFFHSLQSNYEYIQVNLGAEYRVVDIKYTGRISGWCCPDRFEYMEARVGNRDYMTTEGLGNQLSNANQPCGPNSGVGPRTSFLFQCGTSGIAGQFVTIQKLPIGQAERWLEVVEIDIHAWA